MTERQRSAARLRVAILVDGLGLSGGGERFARELALRLDSARFERVYCVSRWSEEAATSPDGTRALETLREGGVEVLGLRRRSILSVWSWRPLLALLRRGPIDILHSHKFGSNVWAALLGSIARTPVIVAHEHTWSYEGNPIRRFLDRELIARRVDAFACVSGEDRRRMIEVERIDPKRIFLLRTGIPEPAVAADRDLRSELGIAGDQPVVGTVCVLRRQKAIDVLLRAGAILSRQFPRLRIVIVGDGPERAALESQARSLGLGDVALFLGNRSDVADLLPAFDVAVSSSDFEGVPLALMEFMAAGLPVVATRVGGVPELIEDGVEGRLVPRRNPEQLALAVAELLSDRSAAAAMGDRARQRQRAEFDIDVAVRRAEELYERLYAEARRPAASRSWR